MRPAALAWRALLLLGAGSPAGIRLQVTPNPARGTAHVGVTGPAGGHARVTVTDVLGRTVALLFDGGLGAGQPVRLALDAGALGSGVYLVRVQMPAAVAAQSFTVAR